jgi:hypothetical protein
MATKLVAMAFSHFVLRYARALVCVGIWRVSSKPPTTPDAGALERPHFHGVNFVHTAWGLDMTYLRNQPYDEKDFPAFAGIKEQLGFLPNFFVE